MKTKGWTILGQDPEMLVAIWANVVSWLVSTFAPSLLPRLLPPCAEEEDDDDERGLNRGGRTRCVSIGRPGGLEQLRVVTLRQGVCTVGYNVLQCPPPFTPPLLRSSAADFIPPDCVIIRNEAFSVNYADCTIRWGLYESAKRFVGWPIVPGFDVAGVIEQVGQGSDEKLDDGDDFRVGDHVFGVTFFGAYSNRVLVPKTQLRQIGPSLGLTMPQAAAIPSVSLTALYALKLAGHYPTRSTLRNRSILIHSAAGGVGSMLVQMAKILDLSPIVGVVGSMAKVDEARALGCDVVIDKSSEDLWDAAERAVPDGYAAIMDANGVSTLAESYDHLAPTGRLIVFGFHSNLPVGRAMLSPMEWIRMARKMTSMPKFDAMDLCTSNKSILGFNLSFFSEEKDAGSELMGQICTWFEEKKLRCPRVVEMKMDRVKEAHELIQSGKSVGKIVLVTGDAPQ